MITILYTLGNGYHCHCCSQSWLEYQTFEDEESAINELTKIATKHEDFRGINEIFIHSNDEQTIETIERIKHAIRS